MFSFKKTYPDNVKMHQFPDMRLFKITSVYYDEFGGPNSWAEKGGTDLLDGWESYKELEGTLELIQGALAKPILDLDEFPNIYKGDEFKGIITPTQKKKNNG